MTANTRLGECQVEECRRQASSIPLEAVLPSGVILELAVCWLHAELLEREFGNLAELAEDQVA